LVKDKNGSLRLEISKDHPSLVQHSRFHTQGWRANGDVSLIISKSDPEEPFLSFTNAGVSLISFPGDDSVPNSILQAFSLPVFDFFKQ
jgi:hypothetical protein